MRVSFSLHISHKRNTRQQLTVSFKQLRPICKAWGFENVYLYQMYLLKSIPRFVRTKFILLFPQSVRGVYANLLNSSFTPSQFIKEVKNV